MKWKKVRHWTRTPAQGRILSRLCIESCGKRGEIEIAFADGAVLRSALSSNVVFASLEGVEQTLRSLDDVWIELVIQPAAGRVILLEIAEVDEWRDADLGLGPIPEAPEAFEELHIAFDFRIGLRDVTPAAAATALDAPEPR